MKAHKPLTLQEAREALRIKGLSIRRWALANGVEPHSVRAILGGKLNYNIGKSHKIAVLLGIKEGEIVD